MCYTFFSGSVKEKNLQAKTSGVKLMKDKSAVLVAKEGFLQLFNKGDFPSETKLPSEHVMSQLLGVSRETWRKAVRLLRSEGILISRHGSGTYVADHGNRIFNNLSELQSMTKMIADAGIQERESNTSCEVKKAPPEVCQFFNVSEETPFFLLRKIRLTDIGVISASMNYLPLQYADHINMSDPPRSVFAYLETNYQIVIAQALTELFIPPENDPLRRLLNLPKGISPFGFRQSHIDSRGNPILYSLDYLRSDLFNFTIMRTRP